MKWELVRTKLQTYSTIKVLVRVQLSPLEAIEEYTGLKRGNIKANYGNCTMIPDPSELDVAEKNLLILDDCFLGPQSKVEAYYTRGRHNNCDTFYIMQNYFKNYRKVWNETNHNFVTIDLTSGKLNGKYRKNLDCFYLTQQMKI